jgi:hypothetical protein
MSRWTTRCVAPDRFMAARMATADTDARSE